jgi:hypothetical protein
MRLPVVCSFYALSVKNALILKYQLQIMIILSNIMKRVEPLLCNDRDINKYTRTVSRQRLVKHFSAATVKHATIEVLLETVFYIRSVQRGSKET